MLPVAPLSTTRHDGRVFARTFRYCYLAGNCGSGMSVASTLDPVSGVGAAIGKDAKAALEDKRDRAIAKLAATAMAAKEAAKGAAASAQEAVEGAAKRVVPQVPKLPKVELPKLG